MLIPRSYQLETIEVCKRRNLLDADECGLGKTLIAVEAVKALVKEHHRPALIVVKKRLRTQWIKALVEQGIARETIIELDASAKSLDNTLAHIAGPVIILTHYEIVVKHVVALHKHLFSIVVCDEAHAIKNRKAQRTEAVKQLRSIRRLALTGTAFDRNPADVWSILNWLQPDVFKSYWKFFDAHVAYKVMSVSRGRSVKTPLGVADYEKFARVLRQYSVRRRKVDVRADMPAKIEQVIEVDLLPDQQSVYNRIDNAKDILVNLSDDASIQTLIPIRLTEILRLSQAAVDPELLGMPVGSAKLDWLADWLEENNETSVIVFTRFRETAAKLHRLYGGKLIVGGSGKVVETTSGDKLIFGTIAAMGEGLDLPHISTAIFLDVDWSSILMTQAVDRIYRINITESKHIIYLKGVNTIDDLLLAAVQGKWTQRELVEAYVRGKDHSDGKVKLAV